MSAAKRKRKAAERKRERRAQRAFSAALNYPPLQLAITRFAYSMTQRFLADAGAAPEA